MVSTRTLLCSLLAFLATPLCTLTLAHSAPQTPPTAAAIYDRVGAEVSQLNRALEEGVAEGTESRADAFRASARADERMQAWLNAAQPLGDELIAATALPYTRPLEYSNGFALLLPHLALMRDDARMLALLMHDAALRNDAARACDLAMAQVGLATRCAEDGLLISSLVSIAITKNHLEAVKALLERKDLDAPRAKTLDAPRAKTLDAPRAKTLLAARECLHTTDAFAISRAIANEDAMMRKEFALLATLPSDKRAARIAELGMTEDDELSDAAITAALANAPKFYEIVTTAIKNPDRAAGQDALQKLTERLTAGEFGELFKDFAPSLTRVLASLTAIELALSEQDALLRALVSE